eukprot:JP435827.1.p1 GENE.JP435827.1~~JP435827.1.p1  ORF type:complete len:364 (+),score=183.51 JP435827.1:2-1093(+)
MSFAAPCAAGDFAKELIATANAITAPGKGILAADESTGTIGKRFDGIQVENTVDNRQAYRELLFTTPDLGKHISGVIFYDETLRQSTKDGIPFPKLLADKGVIVGIKVDLGVVPIPGCPGETFTQGMTDLHKRCAEYYALGARFAKWRNVLTITENGPSQLAIDDCASTLARYGAICQANGLVPIIEPEILMDGKHDLAKSEFITTKVLAAVYKAIQDNHLLLEGTLLKPNMCCPGQDCPAGKATPEQVATATMNALSRTVPVAVPGVTFLSGGQTEIEATSHLNAMNSLGRKKPWSLTFSYGRALQHSVLKAWMGKPENVAAAQAVLQHRAKSNGLANLGKYEGEDAVAGADESLFQSNYSY